MHWDLRWRCEDLTLKQAGLELGLVDEATLNCVVDPKRMVKPYVTAAVT